MCFAKSAPAVVKSEPVVRHEANASITKNNSINAKASGYSQNIRTSAFGIDELPNTNKKTLLGE